MYCKLVFHEAFDVIGRETWIGGTEPDNAAFGAFWDECGRNGFLKNLNEASGGQPGRITGGIILGVSRIQDPAVRNFFYFIAIESDCSKPVEGSVRFTVPAGQWAIFGNVGKMPDALVEAEMFAFQQWLPSSGMRHAAAPELEVYLPGDSADTVPVEFWLPVEKLP